MTNKNIHVLNLIVLSCLVLSSCTESSIDVPEEKRTETPPMPPEMNCAQEGEQYSETYGDFPDKCCEGLTQWESGMDTRVSIGGECYETGRLSGSPVGTCIACGDSVCTPPENLCNCPGDCQQSEFVTEEEFCNDEEWQITLKEACKRDDPATTQICQICEE